jgi:ArsR family transcriptional regulator, arsenate/arsenite/antimonite-responsive transcriptional repressor
MIPSCTCETYIEVARQGQHAHLFDICQDPWQHGHVPKTLPTIDISAPVCCAPVAAGPMSDDDALHVALRLKALADPVRVKIVSLLFSSASGEQNSGDLATALGLSESTVSHHMNQLRRAGLVESERRGMNVYHRAHRDALGALCVVLDPNCCT